MALFDPTADPSLADSTPSSGSFSNMALPWLLLSLGSLGQRGPQTHHDPTQTLHNLASTFALFSKLKTLQEQQRQNQVAGAQDQAGMQGLTDLIQQSQPLPLSGDTTTPTGAEGLRPLEQTGFAQPDAFHNQRSLDPVAVQRLMSMSPSVMKMILDANYQSYLQNQGLVVHPDQAKATVAARLQAQNVPTLSGPFAEASGLSPESAQAIVGAVPAKDLPQWGAMQTRSNRADTAQQLADLRWAIQQGDTPLSQAIMKKLGMTAEHLQALTANTLGETAPARAKLALTEEQLKSLQALTPARVGALEGRAAQSNASAERTVAETPFIAPTKQADLALKRKRLAQEPTTPKEAQGDKDVKAIAMQMRQLTDDPKSFWGNPGKTKQQKAMDMITQMHALSPAQAPKYMRAYQMVYGGETLPTTGQPAATTTRPTTASEWLQLNK